jgi:hypothetical protein
MASLPHDVADLNLAPVALAIDARIEELSRLDAEELALRIGMESDQPAWTREFRELGLVTTVGYLIDTHGWELSIDQRGIKLSHHDHSVVLGVPDTFTAYLAHER